MCFCGSVPAGHGMHIEHANMETGSQRGGDCMAFFIWDCEEVDLCQYFGQKKLKDYATFLSSSSSFCCGVR